MILVVRTGTVALGGLAMRSRSIVPAVFDEYCGDVLVQLGRGGVSFGCALVCLLGVLVGLLGVGLRLGHLVTGRPPC